MTAAAFPTVRLRRLRRHPILRGLVRETYLSLEDLIFPLFVKEDEGGLKPIGSMPGHAQIPVSLIQEEIEKLLDLGISAVMLFGIPSKKDPLALQAFQEQGVIQRAIKNIRSVSPDILIVSDLCFCEYTDHGHCGFLRENQEILEPDNDITLEFLARLAVSHAKAGADLVAPSGMIDGMVGSIRQGLDGAGFSHIPILSYSVKYNSCFYGPFRDAAQGAPKCGDRSFHQMDTANAREAIRECEHDLQEGADMLMVKPAHAFLDVIFRIKERFGHVPLGAYHTSGEFAMIKAAAERGWVDEQKAVFEVHQSIRRAGADFIISYYAKELARWGLRTCSTSSIG